LRICVCTSRTLRSDFGEGSVDVVDDIRSKVVIDVQFVRGERCEVVVIDVKSGGDQVLLMSFHRVRGGRTLLAFRRCSDS